MNQLALSYLYLAFAIVSEVIGTTFLQKSEQFSRLVPTLLVGVFYAASFFLLSLALKNISLGVAYAIWGGVGIVLTAIIGVVVFRQTLDAGALVGIGLIVAGVIVANVFSNTLSH
ncbi:MAG: DMT family transporter [Desulfovibrio sp.]|uniref:DMT family transporter n=1 Tax=Desulfovibrio sp. 7SRBS1 TaxID=3378064 RepID=UPI003B4068DF